MNTKDNRRSQNTDEQIVRAVYDSVVYEKKNLSKVTVREVCEKAGINRSTFYAHYMDVFDVVEKVEARMSTDLTNAFLDAMDAGEHIDGCFIKLFAFIKEHKDFYSFYLNETNKTGVISLAWNLIQDRAKGITPETVGSKTQKELEYSGIFFLHGITGLVRYWLSHDCEETPEELFDILAKQFDRERMESISF